MNNYGLLYGLLLILFIFGTISLIPSELSIFIKSINILDNEISGKLLQLSQLVLFKFPFSDDKSVSFHFCHTAFSVDILKFV